VQHHQHCRHARAPKCPQYRQRLLIVLTPNVLQLHQRLSAVAVVPHSSLAMHLCFAAFRCRLPAGPKSSTHRCATRVSRRCTRAPPSLQAPSPVLPFAWSRYICVLRSRCFRAFLPRKAAPLTISSIRKLLSMTMMMIMGMRITSARRIMSSPSADTTLQLPYAHVNWEGCGKMVTRAVGAVLLYLGE
jgi:hypothetical protein